MSLSTTGKKSDPATRRGWLAILLLGCALLLLGVRPAHAQSVSCTAGYGGVVDGNVTPVPNNLAIDGPCTIENYQDAASSPNGIGSPNGDYGGTLELGIATNTPLILDNVDFDGQISCDKPHGNIFWIVNSEVDPHQLFCMSKVGTIEQTDKIDKANPPGPPDVSIGVPFTYTLTFPQLYDPVTNQVVNPNGSNVPVSQVVVNDNLNATGVSLSYVSSTAAWKGSGAAVPFAAVNNGGQLTFSGFPTIPAGQQIVLKITVVLNSTVPPNSPGTRFINTANWTLGTTINGSLVFPLPGQQGVSPPLTIVAPSLVMTKSGPATMSVGQPARFGLDVQNTGAVDAWNVTIQDKLPTGATGGMCAVPPQVLSVQIPGKGVLAAGTDYTVGFSGAGSCTLTINLLTAAAAIGPGQHLVVSYQAELDADSQFGVRLSNVAGTTQWYDAPSSVPTRQSYNCILTNGTPGIADCQDVHTVTVVAPPALAVSKQVSVVGGGPAVPGATLDYVVHVVNNSTSPATPVVLTDDLNAAGSGLLTYVPGTATMTPSSTGVASTNGITVAGNVITANYSATYGALASGASADLHFLATIGTGAAAGTTITNTGTVAWGNPTQTGSGSVSIAVAGPASPALTMTKSGPATMNIGQLGQFTLSIQNTGTADAWNATIVDELPTGATGGMCTAAPQILSAQVFQADGVTPVAGKGPLAQGADYTVSYAGSPTCRLTINLLTPAATIGSTQRLIITYQTQLDAGTQNGASLTNIAGATQWYDSPSSNPTRQSFTCTLTNGTPGVIDCQDSHTVAVATSGLTITKAVAVAGGGPPVPGAMLNYVLHVTNTTANPATPVVITDDLSIAGAGALAYVAGSATMTPSSTGVASANGIAVAGSVITASYSATYGALAPGASVDLRFQAILGAALTAGTTVTNTGTVTWNNPIETASGSVSVQVLIPTPPALTLTKGGPTTIVMGQQGQFTLNVQNTGTTDAWNAVIVDKLPTGATGGMCAASPKILSAQVFQADGVTPVPGKGPLAPGTDYTVSYAGTPNCTLTISLLSAPAVIGWTQRLILAYQTQLDPNTQNGAPLTNFAGATQWYNGASTDPTRQSYSCPLTNGTPGVLDCQDAHTVTVASSGLTITKTVTVVGGGAAMAGSTLNYLLHVTNPTANPATPVVVTDDLGAAGAGALTYVAGSATMKPSSTGVISVNGITVTGNVLTADYSGTYGPLAPGATVDIAFQATLGSMLTVGATITNTGTVAWDNPTQTASGSTSVTITNIPPGALSVTKTTPLLDVTRGQLVPYTITVSNVIGSPVQGAALVDRFPAGFRYIKGSARLDGVPNEPKVSGLTLMWQNLSVASAGQHTVVLLLAVGAGVGEGEFVNRAQAFAGPTGPPISGEATATVRVVPDTTFDCTDVFGKVFDDVNRNGRQDLGERGLPGVHVVTTRGLIATTDAYGRFHITCAIVPLEGRGSNFVLKVDERTLPSGYRMSTPAFLVERATRGKALRFDFGASIYRVVGLDLADAVFEPGTTDMRSEWRPRVGILLDELRKAPSVLHLTYLGDVEDPKLVERRLKALERQISAAWDRLHCCYRLTIESEVFWRYGTPPKRPVVEHARGDR